LHGYETRSAPAVAHHYPRDFTFYVAAPASSIHGLDGEKRSVICDAEKLNLSRGCSSDSGQSNSDVPNIRVIRLPRLPARESFRSSSAAEAGGFPSPQICVSTFFQIFENLAPQLPEKEVKGSFRGFKPRPKKEKNKY
jgi:hypothetical protein